mgnify:CR=1 FL=1
MEKGVEMNRKSALAALVFICFLSAISLTRFIASVRANPYTNVSVSAAKAMIDSNPNLVILDVRYLYEYEDGHIRNAILIPKDELAGRLDELDKEKETLVYCRSGVRSAAACAILDANSFTSVYNMQGGILAWISVGYPIEIIFGVIWEEKTYPVITFSNSTIDNFGFNQPLKQINFTVAGSSGTFGFCNVTIPKVLLNGDFTVLIDSIQTDYTLTQNITHSFVYFPYSHSTHWVKIIGTRVIGEPPVGGVSIPVNKLELLAPYIGLASTILIVTVATAIYVKHANRTKEK